MARLYHFTARKEMLADAPLEFVVISNDDSATVTAEYGGGFDGDYEMTRSFDLKENEYDADLLPLDRALTAN